MRRKSAHFRVAERRKFNGADLASVSVELGQVPIFRVRPYRRRKTYALPLADVAALVILNVVRAEAAERRRARGRR